MKIFFQSESITIIIEKLDNSLIKTKLIENELWTEDLRTSKTIPNSKPKLVK